MNRTARLVVLSLLSLLLVAACSSAAAPSAAPIQSAAPSVGGESPAPSDAPGPSAAVGSVTSGEAAAAAVIASDPRFAGLEAKNPDLIGQCCFYEVEPAAGGWKVLIEIGWGDCPAGCIDRHNWTFSVTPTGTVTKLSESGPDVPSGTTGGG
jgi:hypothetical protein